MNSIAPLTKCVVAALLMMICGIARADSPPADPGGGGAKIEVREGDTWSTVTVIRKEGRKLLVRYDDGTQEWVGPDRLRKNGQAIPAAPSQAPDAGPSSPGDIGAAAEVSLDDYTDLDVSSAAEPGISKTPPLPLTIVKPSQDYIAAPIHVTNRDNSIDRLIPCTGAPGAAVVSCGTVFSERSEIVRLDLMNRHQIGSATVIKGQTAVSAVNEGKAIFTTVSMGWDTPIHYWELDGDVYRLKANYDPFGKGGHGNGLAMARFVDATHAIFAANSGETYLVDLKTRKATGQVMRARDSRPFLSPSGQILGVLTDSGTALLIRTSDFTKIAEFPDAGRFGTVAVDPTGTAAAYSTEDEALRVVRIADGVELGMIPGIAGREGHFDLLTADKVFVADKTVFDVKTGLPLWMYVRPATNDVPHILANGQMVMLVNSDGITAACTATLPEGSGKAAASSLSKDSYDIAPGTKVGIGGDFTVFGGNEDKAIKMLTDRLTAAKLTVVDDAAAPVQLTATVVAGPVDQRAYKVGGAGAVHVVNCPSTNLTISLKIKGTAVWWQTFHFVAGNPLKLTREGQTLQQAADEAALPSPDMFVFIAFPSYMAHGASPGSPPALGSSEITTHGITLSPRPTPPPPPPAAAPPPATPKLPAPPGKPV